MRGSDLNKAIHKSNYFIKKTLVMSTSFFNVLVLILYYFNNRLDLYKFVMSSIPELLVIFCIFKISTPKIIKSGKIEELVDPGTSLSGKGVPSLLFDSLVICMIVKLLIFYSYWWCVLYILILVCAIYEFIYKTIQKFKKD
ncbi:uncharacterized protein VNE69_03305 [Vairimorpha necatrix]|uniref:Membrane protein n=1 Tax=Vairimorpha necatrix TaxID=6039 RepID=A0AAX4JAT0_9MICR